MFPKRGYNRCISMLDKDLAVFLERGLVIHMATRNQSLQPNGARVSALEVDVDRDAVVAYVPTVAAGPLLDDLRSNGQAAIVCVWPPDDRGCQLKGRFVDARECTDDERPRVMAQWERLLDSLEVVGLPRQASDSWVVWPCVAIRVRVGQIFDQTPGPGAGAPLDPGQQLKGAR
jgi:hypothetical protein